MLSNKLVKKIHFDNNKVIEGLNKLADAVGSTLGASGRSVILEDDYGNAHVTKDGVTVAEAITLGNPQENLGCTLMKQAAKQTANKAGDGTTTSTVLAQGIIKEYFDQEGHKHPFRSIRAGVEQTRDMIIGELEKRAIPVDDKLLKYVSTISTNNDKELGDTIAEAFSSAGENGVVTVETSPTSETFVKVVEGTKISGTCKTQHFLTNKEKEVSELNNPLVFLSVTEIPNVRKIQDILEYAIKSNRAILLVAPLDSQPLAALAMNKVKGNIKVNVIDPPSFGQKRKDLLEDLALLLGAKVFDHTMGDSLDAISPELLGSADKAISDKEGTVLVVENKSEETIERITGLKSALKDEDHPVALKHIENRLALLSGGVSVVYVGGDTEIEQKERLDRVDDAVHAVKAAKKEGILPGGGSALGCIASNHKIELGSHNTKGYKILLEAVRYPYNKILDNAGLDPKAYTFKKKGLGVDVITGDIVDMIEAGIVDPLLVTKQALINAVSVALTILSTDAIISNVRDD